MLRNVYAPSDFESHDADPSLTAEEKLAVIASTPVEIAHTYFGERFIPEEWSVGLPFMARAHLSMLPKTKGHEAILFTDYVNVGDKNLYGHGIGSRLLRAAFRYSVQLDEDIAEFGTGWARLGLVNTVVDVLGPENVAVHKKGQRYGWQGERSLDELFDDHPATEGERYLVYGISAHIDRDLAMTWEKPVKGVTAEI